MPVMVQRKKQHTRGFACD